MNMASRRLFSLVAFWFPIIYYARIGVSLQHGRGSYDGVELAFIGLGWLIFVGLAIFSGGLGGMNRAAPSAAILRLALWGLLLFFTNLLFSQDLVPGIESAENLRIMRIFLSGGVVLSALGFLVGSFVRWQKAMLWLCLSIGACLILAKVFALLASPHPFIDVFTISTAACDYFRQGINPYAQSYPDIYRGAYGYTPTYPYWPGVLLPQTLSRLVLGDIRFAYILADLVTVASLISISKSLRWPRDLSYLAPLLWLSFPVTLFVLDQSWIDTFLVTATTVFVAMFLGKRWVATGIALGYLCATKQYSVFFAFLSLLMFLTPPFRASKAFLKVTVATLVSFLILMLPFIVWDWDAFYRSTIAEFLVMPMRPDALTVIAALYWNLGWSLSGSVSAMIYLVVLGGASVFLWKRSRDSFQALRAWSAAVVMVYGVIFLFGKQAFCNYYYLLAYFVLVNAVVGLQIESDE
jgi:hypothetical protein